MDKYFYGTTEYVPMFLSLNQSMERTCSLGGTTIIARLGLNHSNHSRLENSVMFGVRLEDVKPCEN